MLGVPLFHGFATVKSMESDHPTAEVVVISMNPNSGATDRRPVVEKLMTSLLEQNFEVLLLTEITAVIEVVNQHFGGRLRCVVAAGGDGTISLLANQLPDNTPLAILPLGTENLLAKYLGVSSDPTVLADMIVAGNCRQLDVGRANGKLFLVMASCGFDADVVHRLQSRTQRTYPTLVLCKTRRKFNSKVQVPESSNFT